jgi:hypothetical protein
LRRIEIRVHEGVALQGGARGLPRAGREHGREHHGTQKREENGCTFHRKFSVGGLCRAPFGRRGRSGLYLLTLRAEK